MAGPNLLTPPQRKNPPTMAPTVQLPVFSSVKFNATSKNITGGLKIDTYKALVDNCEESHKQIDDLTKQLSAANTLNGQLNKQIHDKDASMGTKDTLIEQLTTRVQDSSKQIEAQTTEINRQTKQIEDLKEALNEALSQLKDAGKFSKHEQSNSVLEAIKLHVRLEVSRTVKFAREAKLEAITREIYEDLKTGLGIGDETKPDDYVSQDEFVRIYQQFVNTCLGNRRQYVQSEMLKAMKSKSSPFVGLFACQVPL